MEIPNFNFFYSSKSNILNFDVFFFIKNVLNKIYLLNFHKFKLT